MLSLREPVAHARTTGAFGEPAAEDGLVLRSRLLGDPAGLLELLDADAEGQLLELPPRMDRFDERRVELDRVTRETIPVDAGKRGSIWIEDVFLALVEVGVLDATRAD